ncbi:copper amine oxidase N-terminal domain-containing protein [Paenibacillus doosanensis]|uniref:copper amine oxidase N-terminal domain-containing protein n=1 Tax=Paenibacillus doosanensis TaxID=1229154 RepID=UPI00217FB24F|nr:copper amine oxidase N-terminal domain-containing protein [Paenibacillus doosanensis]MCS7465012.1 copper amine oxidase N-terminal domain-containing protein [Paenibacillus doosanensis]
MKKMLTGVLIGCILSTSTIALADNNTVETILFPVKYIINGKPAELDSDYVTLNYQGHAYVPIRFVAENMGGAVIFDPSQKVVIVDSTVHSDLKLMDPNEERVRAGDLKLTYSNGKTTINGKIQVIGGEEQNTIRGAKLNFYDSQNQSLAEVPITVSDTSPFIEVKNNEIVEFTITTSGDITQYSNVTLTIGLLNEIKNVPPFGQ